MFVSGTVFVLLALVHVRRGHVSEELTLLYRLALSCAQE